MSAGFRSFNFLYNRSEDGAEESEWNPTTAQLLLCGNYWPPPDPATADGTHNSGGGSPPPLLCYAIIVMLSGQSQGGCVLGVCHLDYLAVLLGH